MSPSDFLWITEAEVVSMMDMAQAIRALEAGLLAEARGEAQNMTKTHVAWEKGSTLHAIGAAFPKRGFAGTKTWAHTESGATPLLIVYDSNTGALRAVIEAFALGQMRTGAASGVATRYLAAPGADEMAIIGAGKQALMQVAAVAAVRPLKRVRVFARNAERRELFAAQVREELGIEAEASSDIGQAVADAPIITTVTRAKEPFLTAALVARGAHINAVGAIVPTGAEVARDLLERCALIVVDSLPQAQKLSRELIDHFGSDSASWEEVRTLAELAAAQKPRQAAHDLTLFKSLGMGISDLSLGIELYCKAVELGLGRKLPAPVRVAPRLRTARVPAPAAARR